jgi:hypothetical protein
MKELLFTAAVAAAALAGHGYFAIRAQGMSPQDMSPQDVRGERAREDSRQAGVFDRWLSPDAPECVPLSDIASVSRLTPEQFEFARALYIAIPPISRELPPGDSAIVASAGGKAMVALIGDGRTCARFLAPDFILSMLVQVGKGENGMIGQPI